MPTVFRHKSTVIKKTYNLKVYSEQNLFKILFTLKWEEHKCIVKTRKTYCSHIKPSTGCSLESRASRIDGTGNPTWWPSREEPTKRDASHVGRQHYMVLFSQIRATFIHQAYSHAALGVGSSSWIQNSTKYVSSIRYFSFLAGCKTERVSVCLVEHQFLHIPIWNINTQGTLVRPLGVSLLVRTSMHVRTYQCDKLINNCSHNINVTALKTLLVGLNLRKVCNNNNSQSYVLSKSERFDSSLFITVTNSGHQFTPSASLIQKKALL